MGTFKIDFFELVFLAEACIPTVPIARAMFWKNLIDVYYEQMSEDERKRLFEFISGHPKFSKHVEDCRIFFARFNPNNQWLVKCFHMGSASEIRCFRMNDRFYTKTDKSVNPEYIKEFRKYIPHGIEI